MNVHPMRRALTQGTKTVPVESRRRAKKIGGNISLDAAELAIALEMAITERIERDVAAYRIRKRDES